MNEGQPSRSSEKDAAERFALKMIQENGPLLASSHPEIADDARSNITAGAIAKKYKIAELYRVNDVIARKIVNRALEELLLPEERAIRAHEVISETSTVSKENQVGIFGYTLEQRRAVSAMGALPVKASLATVIKVVKPLGIYMRVYML